MRAVSAASSASPDIAPRGRAAGPGWQALLLIAGMQVASAAPAVGPPASAARFAPEKDYGPFVYQAGDGSIRGLSVDMLNLVAARAGIQIQALPARPLSEILNLARNREVDLISSLRPNPERAQFLDFSRPYVEVPAILVTRRDDGAVGLADLGGAPVAVGRSYAVEAFVRGRWPNVQWQPVPDDGQGLEALRLGHVRAVVADAASVAFLWRDADNGQLRLGEEIGFTYPLSFAVCKGDAALLARIDAGLASLTVAERSAVLAHWMPSPPPAPPRRRELLRWIGVGLVAAAGLAGALVMRRRRGRR